MPIAHDAHYSVDIRRPVVNGFCDRCGMMYALRKLDFQYDWRGNALGSLGIRVCPECYDTPQPNGRRPILIGPDPAPVMNARPGFQSEQQEGTSWPYGQVGSLNVGAVPFILDEIVEPTPAPELWNNGGALALLVATGYPTSPLGLAPGAIWNNNGEVAVVPGGVARPIPRPLYFPGVTGLQLLQLGGADLPTTPQLDGSTRLWNNGGGIGVS